MLLILVNKRRKNQYKLFEIKQQTPELLNQRNHNGK